MKGIQTIETARSLLATAMTHIAIQEQIDGKAVDWIEPFAYEQYLAGIKFE